MKFVVFIGVLALLAQSEAQLGNLKIENVGKESLSVEVDDPQVVIDASNELPRNKRHLGGFGGGHGSFGQGFGGYGPGFGYGSHGFGYGGHGHGYGEFTVVSNRILF